MVFPYIRILYPYIVPWHAHLLSSSSCPLSQWRHLWSLVTSVLFISNVRVASHVSVCNGECTSDSLHSCLISLNLLFSGSNKHFVVNDFIIIYGIYHLSIYLSSSISCIYTHTYNVSVFIYLLNIYTHVHITYTYVWRENDIYIYMSYFLQALSPILAILYGVATNLGMQSFFSCWLYLLWIYTQAWSSWIIQ